jgi:hypothetical protein
MASIHSFLKPNFGTFDHEATRVMGNAFDAARDELYSSGQPPIVYEVIAMRIIAAAQKGERDPLRLRDAGLAGIGHSPAPAK